MLEGKASGHLPKNALRGPKAHEVVVGTPFQITDVGMLSDADELLKALKHAERFKQLAHEGVARLTHKCAD
jgi:hypothetical protein